MIFIGIDGGGTKTAVCAYEDGQLIAQTTTGPMNYNFIGVDAALANVMNGIRDLQIPLAQIAAVGVGDPAIDNCVSEDPSSGSYRFLQAFAKHLNAPVYIRSDAYITLFGLAGGNSPAVLMLSGTGSMGMAENAAGEISIVAGWGRLTGDEGSGYYIGLEGLKAALHAADGIGTDTALLQAALTYFDAASPRDLIDIFYGETEPDIAGFSKSVDRCAQAGDPVARQILLQAADYLAAYTDKLVEFSGSRLVGVYGSVICKNAIVRRAYEKKLWDKYPELTITEPPIDAPAAAAMYAEKMYQK